MNTRTDPLLLRPLPIRPRALRPAQVERGHPLGQILVDMGELSAGDMLRAVAMRQREQTRIGDILLANGMVSEMALCRGLAQQFTCDVADLRDLPPDVRLIDGLGVEFCLRHAIVPWQTVGGGTVIATAQPQDFAALRPKLPANMGPVAMAIAPESEILRCLLILRQRPLARRAEARVEATESCRNWRPAAMGRLVAGVVLALTAGLIADAGMTLLVLTLWAVATLVLNTTLKTMAALATLTPHKRPKSIFNSRRGADQAMMRLPKVSILVPLFREREIAGRLVRRLARLSYPRELLEICLVVEEDDAITQAALKAAQLPNWMRQISVPRGGVKTKPRALNYALNFCKGQIIGVYDAEDAPAPDQIHRIVRRFHDAPAQVACLQGILDFYNTGTNWLSRCFAIEYATWFRVVLPGLQRLGLVIPLGGTTLFFRRAALEELGGWDAHNVTEDADLGIRLARHGYLTELISTVTEEEANCGIWAWVKQRSRWLKGYAMTYAVHMRSPARLWRDLGARRFLALQVQFAGTLSQFILAPLLWTFWALPLGYWHPLQGLVPNATFVALATIFIVSELISIAVSVLAVSRTRHRRLWLWVPTMHFYFPLGAIGAYKALWEMVTRPFYWDKTAHGVVSGKRKRA